MPRLFLINLLINRGLVSVEDRDWFLRLANSQYSWKSPTQLANEAVISSSYSEDLLGAMEKSLNRLKPRVPLTQNMNYVSMAVYKRHLSQLLGYSRQNTEATMTKNNPLMMYNTEVKYLPTCFKGGAKLLDAFIIFFFFF